VVSHGFQYPLIVGSRTILSKMPSRGLSETVKER
jgi:hypothetical protein